MTEKYPWIKYITREDIPNDDLMIFTEYVGMDKAVDIILALPGITIPIPRKPFRIAKEKYIIENYNGTKYSLNQLALACDLSPKQVYKIIKRYRIRQKRNTS